MPNHTLDTISIKGNNQEEVRGLLRLLPETTFQFVRDFQRGLPEYGENYCGQIGIYAKKEPLLGEKGVMLIVVNEHLFGDPTSPDYNPVLRVPDGATDIHVVPPRQPPLKKNHPFAGTEFSYRGASFFFGYELSEGAYSAIIKSIKNKD
jgi:hypothetical protein